jgi:ketosteroid isomerase-like protein
VAVSRRDSAAVAALYADDVVLEIPFHESGRTEAGCYRVVKGKEAVVAQFERGASMFRGMAFEEAEMTTSADGATVFLEARGNMVGADDGTYRNRYVFRFDIADGKIRRVREYANPVTAALALGRPIGPQ